MHKIFSRVKGNSSNSISEAKPSFCFSGKVDINLSEQELGKTIKFLIGSLTLGTGASLFGFLVFYQPIIPADAENQIPNKAEEVTEFLNDYPAVKR